MRIAAQCTGKHASVKLQSGALPGHKASILFYGSDGSLDCEGKEEQSGHGTHVSPRSHLKMLFIPFLNR